MQNGILDHHNNFSNNNNDIITFSPITPNIPINNNTNALSKDKDKVKDKEKATVVYCYDNHSGRTIQITKDSIKIYNKNATKLLIDLKLMLPIEKIKMISFQRNLEYALVYLETKTMNKSILVVNLRKGLVISILQDDYRKFLGMIFLSIGNQYDHNQQFLFCIIFEDRITVKMINKDPETIVDVKSIKYPNSGIKIDEYIYNKTFKVLCCIRSDNTFDFYNLGNEMYLAKAFNWNIMKRRRRKHWSNQRYEGMQFFLQVLYNKLYWIIFDVEQKTVILFKMKDMNSFSKPIGFQVNTTIKTGTLAFVDNMIIVFDYDTFEMTVIDLLSYYDNKIISRFIYSNPYALNSELITFKGGSIAQYDSSPLYDLTFNLSAYYNSFPYRLKQEALLGFLKRKNAKTFIYQSLNDMIKRQFKTIGIFAVLNAIAEEIWKGTYEKIDINDPLKPTELILPFEYVLKRRNRKMKHYDSYVLFKSIESNPGTDEDLLRYVMMFTLILNSYGIKPPPNFILMTLGVIQRIPIEKVIDYFELIGFFDHEDVAIYLLQLRDEVKDEGMKEKIKQIAFDILKRLMKYEYIVMYLFNEGLLKEAIICCTCYNKNKIALSEWKMALSNWKIDSKYKKLLLQYIGE